MPGFLSYARADNDHAEGKILEFAVLLETEVQGQSGDLSFRIYRDLDEHTWGADWKRCIECGLDEAAVLIPVLSPTYLRRSACREEFEQFLEKQRRIFENPKWDRRHRLILPLLFRDVHQRDHGDVIYTECYAGQVEEIESLIQLGRPLKSRRTGTVIKRLAKKIIELHELLQEERQAGGHHAVVPRPPSLEQRLETLASRLTGSKHTLPNGEFIERVEITQIVQTLNNESRSEQYLLGGPGSGKSAVLREVALRWQTAGNLAVVIKADQLPTEIDTLAKLSEWILGRNADVVSELSRLAENRRIAVLIDQLDSLANLTDLESGRLNAILDFIQTLRNRTQISLVAASREIELNSDLRLSALLQEAQDRHPHRVVLAPLPEACVVAKLQGSGFEPQKWPQRHLEFLAVPYHLSLFLQHAQEASLPRTKVPEDAALSSLRSVHDARWAVLQNQSDGEATSLLTSLADNIRKSEVLWQDRSSFACDDSTVARLIRSAWLQQRDDDIAFAHQTQYEYVMAKNLAMSVEGFVRHVEERQHGLNVRPAIWHTLHYLRDTSKERYLQAFSNLLAIVSRRHLIRLLIEFLCSVQGPMPREVEWMEQWLEAAETQAQACYRLRGNSEWFRALPDELVKQLMLNGVADAWPIAALLSSLLASDRERVIQLIGNTWAFHEQFDSHVLSIAADIDEPSQEMVTWLLWIISHYEGDAWKIERVKEAWKKRNAKQAIRVFTAWLQRRADQLEKGETLELPKAGTSFGSRKGRFIEETEELVQLLNKDAWQDAIEFAAQEPTHFLSMVWPWLIRVLLNQPRASSSGVNQFSEETGRYRWLPLNEDDLGSPIIQAVERSIQHASDTNSDGLAQFVTDNVRIDSLTVQRFLLFAVERIAAKQPAFALAVLQQDSRRLWIDLDYRVGSGAVAIARAAMPFWTKEQKLEFQRSVLAWQPYLDPTYQDLAIDHQAALLVLVPVADRTASTRDLLHRHGEQLHQSEEERGTREATNLQDEEELRVPTGDELSGIDVATFIRVVDRMLARASGDQAAWPGSRSKFYHIESLFGDYCRRHCQQAMDILNHLSPARHGDLAAILVRILDFPSSLQGEDGVPKLQPTDVVMHALSLGFDTRKFHDAVGYAAYNIGRQPPPIPSKIVEKLREWLLTDPVQVGDAQGNSSADRVAYLEAPWRDGRAAVPFIWGHHTGDFVPNEFYWMAEAIKIAEYNGSQEANTSSWSEVMHACVERNFSDYTWRCWLFSAVNYVPDRAKFAAALVHLLETKPHLVRTREACLAIAKFSPWIEPTVRLRFVHRLLESEVLSFRQAAGELTALFAIQEQDESCHSLILGRIEHGAEHEAFLTGTVHTAAYLVTNAECRPGAVDLLVACAGLEYPHVVNAYAVMFRHKNALQDDIYTSRLLEAFAERFPFTEFNGAYGLPQALWPLTSSYPQLVLRICSKLVKAELASRPTGRRYRLDLAEEVLVTIATTLHRRSDTREAALTLFEDLQELEAKGVEQFLQSLDGRLP